MRRLLFAACVAALCAAPTADAGGLRVNVSGTGGGYVALWNSEQQQCRQGTPLNLGGCIFGDGGGGLILRAVPDAGSVFDGWPDRVCFPYPGGYCQASGSQGPSCCNQISVSFTKLRYTLGVSVTGTGKGAVLSAPDGISCATACNASYDWGTVVTMTPQPATGSTFTAWTGTCSGSGACTVTLTAAATVTAVFELGSFPLEVTKTGTGRGTVTSTPQGVGCGTRCNSAFLFGSQVTLAAVAASGSYFAGWSGSCSGVTACSLPIMAGPISVGARFDPVLVTARFRGRTLSLALSVERSSRLTIAIRGPASLNMTSRIGPGRADIRLTLPRRFRAGRYTARYFLRDAVGSAALNVSTLTLR